MTRPRKYHKPLPQTFDEVLKFIADEKKPQKGKKQKDEQEKPPVNKSD